MLRDAVAETKRPGAADAYTRERLTDLLEFFESMTNYADQMRKLPTPAVVRLIKMGARVGKLLRT
jgi:hypothetical protein